MDVPEGKDRGVQDNYPVLWHQPCRDRERMEETTPLSGSLCSLDSHTATVLSLATLPPSFLLHWETPEGGTTHPPAIRFSLYSNKMNFNVSAKFQRDSGPQNTASVESN